MSQRVHIGGTIALAVSPVAPDLTPSLPSSTPLAKIYDASGTLIETVKLPLKDLTDKVFQLRHKLGTSYSAGRYLVIYQWVISSVTYQRSDLFDVLAGGDADGAVIGMAFVDQPLGRYVIYETESGRLVSGLNPRR